MVSKISTSFQLNLAAFCSLQSEPFVIMSYSETVLLVVFREIDLTSSCRYTYSFFLLNLEDMSGFLLFEKTSDKENYPCVSLAKSERSGAYTASMSDLYFVLQENGSNILLSNEILEYDPFLDELIHFSLGIVSVHIDSSEYVFNFHGVLNHLTDETSLVVFTFCSDSKFIHELNVKADKIPSLMNIVKDNIVLFGDEPKPLNLISSGSSESQILHNSNGLCVEITDDSIATISSCNEPIPLVCQPMNAAKYQISFSPGYQKSPCSSRSSSPRKFTNFSMTPNLNLSASPSGDPEVESLESSQISTIETSPYHVKNSSVGDEDSNILLDSFKNEFSLDPSPSASDVRKTSIEKDKKLNAAQSESKVDHFMDPLDLDFEVNKDIFDRWKSMIQKREDFSLVPQRDLILCLNYCLERLPRLLLIGSSIEHEGEGDLFLQSKFLHKFSILEPLSFLHASRAEMSSLISLIDDKIESLKENKIIYELREEDIEQIPDVLRQFRDVVSQLLLKLENVKESITCLKSESQKRTKKKDIFESELLFDSESLAAELIILCEESGMSSPLVCFFINQSLIFFDIEKERLKIKHSISKHVALSYSSNELSPLKLEPAKKESDLPVFSNPTHTKSEEIPNGKLSAGSGFDKLFSGKWQCQVCMSHNDKNFVKCQSCDTPKDIKTEEKLTNNPLSLKATTNFSSGVTSVPNAFFSAASSTLNSGFSFSSSVLKSNTSQSEEKNGFSFSVKSSAPSQSLDVAGSSSSASDSKDGGSVPQDPAFATAPFSISKETSAPKGVFSFTSSASNSGFSFPSVAKSNISQSDGNNGFSFSVKTFDSSSNLNVAGSSSSTFDSKNTSLLSQFSSMSCNSDSSKDSCIAGKTSSGAFIKPSSIEVSKLEDSSSASQSSVSGKDSVSSNSTFSSLKFSSVSSPSPLFTSGKTSPGLFNYSVSSTAPSNSSVTNTFSPSPNLSLGSETISSSSTAVLNSVSSSSSVDDSSSSSGSMGHATSVFFTSEKKKFEVPNNDSTPSSGNVNAVHSSSSTSSSSQSMFAVSSSDSTSTNGKLFALTNLSSTSSSSFGFGMTSAASFSSGNVFSMTNNAVTSPAASSSLSSSSSFASSGIFSSSESTALFSTSASSTSSSFWQNPFRTSSNAPAFGNPLTRDLGFGKTDGNSFGSSSNLPAFGSAPFSSSNYTSPFGSNAPQLPSAFGNVSNAPSFGTPKPFSGISAAQGNSDDASMKMRNQMDDDD